MIVRSTNTRLIVAFLWLSMGSEASPASAEATASWREFRIGMGHQEVEGAARRAGLRRVTRSSEMFRGIACSEARQRELSECVQMRVQYANLDGVRRLSHMEVEVNLTSAIHVAILMEGAAARYGVPAREYSFGTEGRSTIFYVVNEWRALAGGFPANISLTADLVDHLSNPSPSLLSEPEVRRNARTRHYRLVITSEEMRIRDREQAVRASRQQPSPRF